MAGANRHGAAPSEALAAGGLSWGWRLRRTRRSRPLYLYLYLYLCALYQQL